MSNSENILKNSVVTSIDLFVPLKKIRQLFHKSCNIYI